MQYYTNLFSPETYEAFSRSDRSLSGFRIRQEALAKRIRPGDRFVCYMAKLSRWIGVMEVIEPYFIDPSPLFLAEDDPFIVRFRVRPIIWLPRDKTVPIHEPVVWDRLSFTHGIAHDSSAWTGKVRMSLNAVSEVDGQFLEEVLTAQQADGVEYPVDEDQFRRPGFTARPAG